MSTQFRTKMMRIKAKLILEYREIFRLMMMTNSMSLMIQMMEWRMRMISMGMNMTRMTLRIMNLTRKWRRNLTMTSYSIQRTVTLLMRTKLTRTQMKNQMTILETLQVTSRLFTTTMSNLLLYLIVSLESQQALHPQRT